MASKFTRFHTVTVQNVTLEQTTTLETIAQQWLRSSKTRGHATRETHLDIAETHSFQVRLHLETPDDRVRDLAAHLERAAPERTATIRHDVTFLGIPVQELPSGRVKEYVWRELRDVRPRRHRRAA
ncbi:MAG: hypothetical protein HC933_00175 [Pleurocapsa sp. SU_196_0]|nr:hypothetical protein [Pleurocapsa sp. SU_196_0]